jgi:hypothetical protein
MLSISADTYKSKNSIYAINGSGENKQCFESATVEYISNERFNFY